MSRRFGRQQKRKLKAEVDAASRQAEHYKESAILARRGQEALREAVEITAEVLGENFISLRSKEIGVESIDRRHRMSSYAPQLPICAMSNFDLAEDVYYSVQELEAFRARAERDVLSKAVHLRLKTPNGELAYILSEESMRRLPREILVERLSQQFAEMFAQEMNKL